MAKLSGYIWALMLISLLLLSQYLTVSSAQEADPIPLDNEQQQQHHHHLVDGRHLQSESLDDDEEPKKLKAFMKKKDKDGKGKKKKSSATRSTGQFSYFGSVIASALFLGLLLL